LYNIAHLHLFFDSFFQSFNTLLRDKLYLTSIHLALLALEAILIVISFQPLFFCKTRTQHNIMCFWLSTQGEDHGAQVFYKKKW